LQRPGLQNLINYLKKNKNQIDYLVVTKWCRLSRDVKNTILLVNELVEYGVKVFTLEEGDIADEPSAFFMRYLNMVLPEIDNRMRAKNTKAGIFRALKEGYFPYGTPPRGYSKDHNTPKTPLLVPNEEAEIIREAFELFATDHLSIEDVRRATAKKGVNIGKSQFSLMLRNPVYVGKILVPESKDTPGHLINGIHQGIVSEETFWKVQKILLNRQKKKVYTTIKQKIREEFPLRGFLVCPSCGHNWTGSVSKGNGGQYAYYHCQKGCPASVNAGVANDAFLAYLKTLVPPEEVILLYQKLLKEMVTNRVQGKQESLTGLRKQLEIQESTLLKIDQKRFILEEIDAATYQRLKVYEQSVKEETLRKISEIETLSDHVEQHCQFGMNVLSHMDVYFQQSSVELKQKILGSIFPGKLVFEKGKYRTSGLNPALAIILQKSNELQNEKTGNTSVSENVSGDVPIRGQL
jgi:site-specific DNA recombinase